MVGESAVLRSRIISSDDPDWGIQRAWVKQLPDGAQCILPTSALAQFDVLCCLGNGGLGKTWEIAKLSKIERDGGREVVEILLARYNSPDALRGGLRSALAAVGPTGAVYLDGLDELMVPLRSAVGVICDWVDDELQAKPQVALRLSCRSGVWPKDLLQAIHRTNRSERIGICELQPLDEEQIGAVAASHKLDSLAFLRAVHEKGCLVLAQQPLTLKLLVRMFASRSDLPSSRRGLFDNAIAHMCLDSAERRERGTITMVHLDQLVEAAERLAVIMTLSGQDVVDLNDEPLSGNALGITELAQLPSCVGRSLDSNTLWALANTRIMAGRGVRQYGFVHRQFAEHLAGRRLGSLPIFQAIGFLASDAGQEKGVAGPLREVAAVSAMYNDEIAAWVARTDPEIIGISEVADDKLRRVALLGMFEKFRRNELTDSQIASDKLSFNGLRYPTVADDVRSVLRERNSQTEDVHAFAIALCEAWQLDAVVPELVSCSLDESLPLHTRTAAAFASRQLGTSSQQRLLKPLMFGGDDDADEDLKGIALSANWPRHVTTSELFSVLTPPEREGYLGHYRFFIHELDKSDFDGASDLVAALTWARGFVDRSEIPNIGRALMRRIVMAALRNSSDRNVLEALAAFVSHASRISAAPLFDDAEVRTALNSELGPAVRRKILSCLMARDEDAQSSWGFNEQLPGIFNLEDFPWLLERACNLEQSSKVRERAGTLASWLNWQHRREFVDLWLTAYQEGVLPESLRIPLVSDLVSEQVGFQRRNLQRKNQARPRQNQLVTPPPASIEAMLDRCEQLDPAWFAPLSRELTRTPGSDHHHLLRFLTGTPGWSASDARTKRRVVSAAKAYLDSPTEFLKRVEVAQANEILNDGGMAALFLLQSEEPSWLESRNSEWWTSWAPYILRELHSDLNGEPQGPKERMVALLHQRSAAAVQAYILSVAQDPRRTSLFSGLCRLLSPIEDRFLDAQLTDDIIDKKVHSSSLLAASDFILGRSPQSSTRLVETLLQSSSNSDGMPDARVYISLAALTSNSGSFAKQIFDFMRAQPVAAKMILQMYAYSDRRREQGSRLLDTAASGELLELLFEAFPPEADPVRTGAYWVTEKDAAIALRGNLISQLARHAEPSAASKVFARLEAKFGGRYPWLRRPRSEVARRLQLTSWAPLPPLAIASTLASGERRLLRSPTDVLQAIRFAIQKYEWTLQSKVPLDIQDLWNTSRNYPASPKDEEVVSDKLSAAIQATFKGVAVVASREVQLFRRIRSGSRERAGTRADLMLKLAASGTPADEKISVVIEVKRSCNSEAKTGLRNQLVDLYLLPHGYTYGVFVVAYLNAEGIAASHRPVWKTISDARKDIEGQADDITREFAGDIVVQGIVLDARLPAAVPVRTSRRRARKITANRCRR